MLHGVATLLLGWAIAAPADAPSYRVALQLTEGCEAGAVERQVDALLSSSTAENTDVFARGRIDQANGEYRLMLSISSGGSVEIHKLAAPSCGEVLEAAGMLVAISVDPLVAPVDTEPQPANDSPSEAELEEQALGPEPPPEVPFGELEPEPPVTEASDPTVDVALADDAEPMARAPSRVLVFAHARGGIGYGSLPSFDLGYSGGFGIGIGRQASVELAGAHYVEQLHDDQDLYPGAAIGIRLFSGALVGCWRPSAGRWTFPVCGGAEFGAMQGIGIDAPNPARRTEPWGAAQARVGFRYPNDTRVGLGVDAQGFGAFLRPAFTLAGSQTVFRTAPGGFRALVGLDVRLSKGR